MEHGMRKWVYLGGAVIWATGGIVSGVAGRRPSVGLTVGICLSIALLHVSGYLEERGEK